MSFHNPYATPASAVIGTQVFGDGHLPPPVVGPERHRVMLIGEFPGIDDGRRSTPFMGKSGQELMRYMNGYDLPSREQVYLTNLSKTVVATVKDFTFTEEDEAILWSEIESARPTTIVTLGSHSTQYFLGAGTTIEDTHGILHQPHPDVRPRFEALAGGIRPIIFPSYSPAVMLHSPGLQAVFAYTMRRLSLHLKGRLQASPADTYDPRYCLVDDHAHLLVTASPLGIDTEGWKHLPWGASWSGRPGTGDVARYRSLGWHKFVQHVTTRKPLVILHNSLHDLGVLDAMGLELDEHDIQFEDTMIMAYLLGLEPQGLKTIA